MRSMRLYRGKSMKKSILSFLLAALLALPACTPAQAQTRLTVVCTTYPIYLFASSVAEGVDGVVVERLDTGSTSCLHNYTLSMEDMKKLERADVIAINGAGLEEFLEDALQTSDAQVIDCSAGVELLENLSHHHDEGEEDSHDHGHWDPHYWMDPSRAAQMVDNLEAGLSAADPDHQPAYFQNGMASHVLLMSWDSLARDMFRDFGASARARGLITFHDGFQYFANAYGLTLLASIEEEAGSEASAREIVEITELVKEYDIPVIFTEVSGSDATAKAISRETGCRVVQLTMMMDGPEDSSYLDGLMDNVAAVVNGFAGKEMVRHG